MNIVSFLAPRRDHGRWNEIYFDLLGVLDASCRRLGLRHVVMTDDPTVSPGEVFCRDLPAVLMQAATQAHADWLEFGDWRDDDTLFVGADCLMLKSPQTYLAGRCEAAFTYRGPHSRYPINTGMMYVAAGARDRAAPLFRRVAERTGKNWCADQRALIDELAPMPPRPGLQKRAGLLVEFLPMELFNERPAHLSDPMTGRYMLHFRGKLERKQQMLDWAARWLPA